MVTAPPADLPVILNLVADALAEAGGALTPDATAQLDELPLSIATAEGVIDLIQAAELEAAEAAIAAAPYVAAGKSAKAKVESLRAYLKKRMEAAEVEKLAGKRHSCRLQDGQPSIAWSGEPATIPIDFQKRRDPELDSKAVKLAYERKALPAAFVVTPQKTLVIVG